MGQKLPTDFDGEWYAATYADVGMSGLRPSEHYRLFGRLLERRTSPPAPPPAPPAPPAPAPASAPEPVSRQPEGAAEQAPTEAIPAEPTATQQPEEPEAPPIVERPDGFDPAAVVPRPAPPKLGAEPGGHFSVASLAAAGRSGAITSALAAYAKLVNAGTGSGAAEDQAASCGASAFQAGETRIENAWFASPNRLRLMFAGGTDSAFGSSGSVVRAYQGECASPADLKLLGEGIQLPPLGPVIHEVELLHPLMPLLLELADPDGNTQAFTLLPFPSLLRGGLHGAELKALQTEPNPIDDFWAMSDALLQEMLGGDGWPERSVSGVSYVKAANPDEPLCKVEVQQWLSCIFGIEPKSAEGRRSRSKQARLQLTLPREFVPTISALVTRRLGELPGSAVTGSYLVSDADDYRPRWSIALPAGSEPANAIPVLRRSDSAAGSAPVEELAPMPLAIALRSPAVLTSAPVEASRGKKRLAASGALSVVIDASDAARTEQAIDSIRAAAGGELEVFVRSATADPELRAAFERIAGGTPALPGADLRQIAKVASSETLLTISDRVDVNDGRSLAAVLDLLQRDETTGSASCALLAEKIVKKDVVLQPASGGLFPTGVSFASGPRLAFGEPNAIQALPELDYPVLANTFLFTAWRRDALANLPGVPRTGWANAQDVRLGLDLIRAGYRNWCTTRSTVRLLGSYAPRDGIDPAGPGYLQPEDWHSILRSVTVVRELF